MRNAMILAAGHGKRMGALTQAMPKPLLKVGGDSLIVHLLRRLAQEGVSKVVINTGRLGHLFHQQLGDGGGYGLRIIYSDEGDQTLETGGGIRRALPWLGQDGFIVVNGDLWCDYPFARLRLPKASLAHLVLVPNPPHHPDGDFCLDDGWINSYGKPRYCFSGIGIFHPRLFLSTSEAHFPLAGLLRNAAARHEVSGELYQGIWLDIGTPERLEQLNLEFSLSSDR